MALLTSQDLAILSTWSFLRDYARNRDAFLEVGRMAYRILDSLVGPPHNPSDMELALTQGLWATRIFQILCQSKAHATFPLHSVFALALARYMLDNEWTEITR